jgi:hypothetical protein
VAPASLRYRTASRVTFQFRKLVKVDLNSWSKLISAPSPLVTPNSGSRRQAPTDKNKVLRRAKPPISSPKIPLNSTLSSAMIRKMVVISQEAD